MTPIDATTRVTATSISTGRPELVHVRSRDGQWAFQRLERARTAWRVWHIDRRTQLGRLHPDWFSTLSLARIATHGGGVLAELNRDQPLLMPTRHQEAPTS